jgi:hypothetical protein
MDKISACGAGVLDLLFGFGAPHMHALLDWRIGVCT